MLDNLMNEVLLFSIVDRSLLLVLCNLLFYLHVRDVIKIYGVWFGVLTIEGPYLTPFDGEGNIHYP